MDYTDAINRSNIFEIKKLSNEKVLIKIPFGPSSFEKEYGPDEQIGKVFKDFKAQNGIDISEKFLKNFKNRKIPIEMTDKIQTILDNNYISNISKDKMNSYLLAKPFNNPFEVFVFNKNNKILNIQPFDEELIKSLGLNNYGPSSAYCNGNNHLYISGGEINDKEIIDTFYDIDLQNFQIECPCNIPPKKYHSMLFIPPDKVFFVGGNDTKSFYFNIKEKSIIHISDLNTIRIEPALQIIGNILYCFDNVNKADNNNKITFEKIDISNPESKWEIIEPQINQEIFPQKFFAVSKDNTGENIIFLGGNMDDNILQEEKKNYKYNTSLNLIEQTNIPFHDFNFKEKTFLTYNKNVDYLLPDFNRQHPEVTFYVKHKEKFEKINYLPKTEINENNSYEIRNKYSYENRYNFNMPGINIKNIEIQIQNNNNETDIERNRNQYTSLNQREELDISPINIVQEPPFKEVDIEPNKGDQPINIDIPSKLNKNSLLKEEEKNAEEPYMNINFKYNINPINSSGFNILNTNQSQLNTKRFNSSVNNLGNASIDIKENKIENSKENIAIDTEINKDLLVPEVHMPKQEGINLEEIKLNSKFNISQKDGINSEENAQKNINIGINGPEINLNKKEINIDGNEIDTKLSEQKNGIKNAINVNIQKGNVKLDDSKTFVQKGKIHLEKEQNYEFLQGGTLYGNNKSIVPEFTLYGLIKGKDDSKNNKIEVNVPNIQVNGEGIGDKNIGIDGNLGNKNYAFGSKGMNLKTNLKGPDFSGNDANINIPKMEAENPNINIESPIINANIKKPAIDTNLDVKANLNGAKINEPKIKADLKVPETKDVNLNIKSPEIFETITGIIEGTKVKDPKLNVKISEPKISGNISGNSNLNIDKPNLDVDMPNIDANKNVDINVNKPEIKVPSGELNLKEGKYYELKGEIPGINVNKDLKIKGPKVEAPELSNIKEPNVKIEGKLPNVNINGGKEVIISSGIIGGKTSLEKGKIEMPNVKVNGTLKRPKLNVDGPDVNIKQKGGLNLKQNIQDVNINSPEIPSGNINLKGKNISLDNKIPNVEINKPKIEGDINIPNINVDGNVPQINAETPNFDINKDNIDITGNIPGVGIDAKVPNVDVELNKPKIDINANMPNVDLNKPKIYTDANIPNIDVKNNIPKIEGEIGGNIPKIDGSIKVPELNGINTNLNLPSINKPDINANLEGEIKGIKKPNIEIPKIENEFNLSGIIPGINVNDIKIKGQRKILNQPELNLKSTKIHLNQPDIELKGSRRVDIPNLDVNLKGNRNINSQINSGKLDIPSGNLNIKGPKIEGPDLKNVIINGPNINIDGNLNKPELNINDKNEIIISSGIIPGTKDAKINIPNVNIEGDIKKPKLDVNGPKLNVDLEQKGLNLDKNIKDVNINSPEIPSGNINLKGKKISLDNKIPNVEINKPKAEGEINIPNINVEGNVPQINAETPNFDINKGNIDINGNIPKINIDAEIPNVDLNKPKIDIDAKVPNVDINKPNIDIDAKIPNVEINKPKIDLDTNIPDIKVENNIPKMEGEIGGNIPKIEASIKPPELNGINANLNLPSINKPDINANLEGEIKGIKKPNIEIPKIENEFNLSGIIPGINAKDINIKGPKVDKPNLDVNLKGSKNINSQINSGKLDIPSGNLNIKGPKIEGPDLKNVNINGPNINLEGNLNKPELNINDKNEIIISTGIIPGTKDAKINIPNVNIEGDIKRPKLDVKGPKLNVDIEQKGLNLDKNIKDVNINPPEIPSGNINLKGKNISLDNKIANVGIKKPKIEGEINITNINLEGNLPQINAETPNIDINKGNIDINGNLDAKVPNVDMNKPKIDLNAEIPNIDINKPNIDIDANMPNVELNKPKIDIEAKMPNIDVKNNIPKFEGEMGGNMPKIDASIKPPELNGINANLKMPSINKPDINANLEGEIKGIKKPNIEIPKIENEFNLSGIIPGINVNDINIKGQRKILNQPELNLKSTKIHLNQPDIELKGSRRVDIPNLDVNLKGSRNINTQINSGKLDIPTGSINLKGPKIDDVNLKDVNINGPNINIEGKYKKPELNINGETIISSGIIYGTKDKKIDIPNVKIEGDIKRPKLDIDNPELKVDIEQKGLNLDKNIQNVNINSPEIPSGNINLKGKKISLDNKIPNVEGNIKIPTLNVEGNVPQINAETPNIDINKGNIDINGNIPKIDIDAKVPNVDLNKQKIDLDAEIPNIDINKPNIDIDAKIPNVDLNKPNIDIDAKIPNIELDKPKVDLDAKIPNIDVENNIPKIEGEIGGNMPKIEGSIKSPELNGINANLNIPSINKPDINANLEGEIKGIKKPNIEIPKVENEFNLSGIIPGIIDKDINIKGQRKILNQPELNIKSSKIYLNKPDIELKGSRRVDIPNLDVNLKGSRMLYNNQINSNINIPNNKTEIVVNPPKIDMNLEDPNLKINKPELKTEGNFELTGIIGGDKSSNKNSKINANLPNFEMKGKLVHSNTLKKEEIQTGIIPPSSKDQKINIEIKNYNLLSDQKLDINLPKIEVQNPSIELNNEIKNKNEIKMPGVDINLNQNEVISKGEINLNLDNKEQDNNLINININNNGVSLEESNTRISQNAKKKNKGLPLVGSKNKDFIASKIDVGGKLDVNGVDVSKMKSINVAVNGATVGERTVN